MKLNQVSLGHETSWLLKNRLIDKTVDMHIFTKNLICVKLHVELNDIGCSYYNVVEEKCETKSD